MVNKGSGANFKVEVQIICERSEQNFFFELLYAEMSQ